MTVNIDRLLPEVTMRLPCPLNEMAEFQKLVGRIPHHDYLDFMSRHNGCDGPVGKDGYICLWPIEEVVSGTEQAGAAEFAPDLLLFGGDGGNEAFAFDRQDSQWPIVMVPLVGLSRKDMRFVAATFGDFLHRLATDKLWG